MVFRTERETRHNCSCIIGSIIFRHCYRSWEGIINAVIICSAPNTNDNARKKKATPVSGTSSSDNYRSLIKGGLYTPPSGWTDHTFAFPLLLLIHWGLCTPSLLWLPFPAVLHLSRPPLAPNWPFWFLILWSNFSLCSSHVTRPAQHGCDSVHNTTSPTSALSIGWAFLTGTSNVLFHKHGQEETTKSQERS